MLSFLSWYLLLTALGWLTFPLAYRLFPALPDRGYSLARVLGLLIWGYVFWLFASLGLAQNDLGGLLLGLVILGAVSLWGIGNRRSELLRWLREKRGLVLTVELLFLLAFALMAFIRSANPEIVGTEKPMELMMIHGILRSPTFPPRDLWLSGYSISYYYFGYVMTAMLARFTGVPATLAFNLMIALVFSLSAVGAYGIVYNLLARRRGTAEAGGPRPALASLLAPLLGPVFLLVFSNAEGFLEILHARGLFWKEGPNFWTWLDILELRDPPLQPLAWTPQRGGWWWWRASRVIMDYDLQGNWTLDVINEFPAFSYILGDLHPHVLAMPFVLLALAMALNLFLGGWPGRIDLYFGELQVSRTGFCLLALMLGGLAFLNTWDILIAGALILFSYVLARVRESGWGWARLEDLFLLGIPLLVSAYLLYLPFFIGFDSQAGGLVPNFMFPTRGAQLWVMWGPLFVLLYAYLFSCVRRDARVNWRAGFVAGLGLVLCLLAAMFAIGALALQAAPELANSILASQARTAGAFITDSLTRRLTYIGSLLTLLAILVPALALLFGRLPGVSAGSDSNPDPFPAESEPAESNDPSATFGLLLILLGALLILGPEFLYLRDNFGFRINTIFKFYYQAWIVLSLASAYAVAVLLQTLRGAAAGLFRGLLAVLLLIGLTYPVLAVISKTNGFNPPFDFTLNDFDRLQRESPDEAAALQWLQAAPDGVVAEAVGGAYSSYARVSIYTGLPTVLGWGNHEGQWRDYGLQGTRAQDIETLYSTPSWNTAREILERYNIRYVYVGYLERTTYRLSEEKFNRFLKPAFQQGGVAVYEVP